MSREELMELATSGETSFVKCFPALPSDDEAAAEIAAFVNTSGVLIIIGVDRKTREKRGPSPGDGL